MDTDIKPEDQVTDNDAVEEEDDEFDKFFDELTEDSDSDEFEEVVDAGDDEVKDDESKGSVEDEPDSDKAVQGATGQEAATGDEAGDVSKDSKEEDAEYWRHKYQSDAGRVSAFQRKGNELEQELAKAREAQHEKTVVQSESSEKFSKLKEEFPEIADAVEEIINARVSSEVGRVKQEVDQKVRPLEESEISRRDQIQFEAFEAKHPDWKEIYESADYDRWLDQQPAAMKQMAKSDLADEVSVVFDYFKATQGPKQSGGNEVDEVLKRREKQLADAASVPSRGRSGDRSTAPADDFDQSWEYYANK